MDPGCPSPGSQRIPPVCGLPPRNSSGQGCFSGSQRLGKSQTLQVPCCGLLGGDEGGWMVCPPWFFSNPPPSRDHAVPSALTVPQTPGSVVWPDAPTATVLRFKMAAKQNSKCPTHPLIAVFRHQGQSHSDLNCVTLLSSIT